MLYGWAQSLTFSGLGKSLWNTAGICKHGGFSWCFGLLKSVGPQLNVIGMTKKSDQIESKNIMPQEPLGVYTMNFVGGMVSRLIILESSYLYLPYHGRHLSSVLSQGEAIPGQGTAWLKMLTTPQECILYTLYQSATKGNHMYNSNSNSDPPVKINPILIAIIIVIIYNQYTIKKYIEVHVTHTDIYVYNIYKHLYISDI